MALTAWKTWRLRWWDARCAGGVGAILLVLFMTPACQFFPAVRNASETTAVNIEKANYLQFRGWVRAITFSEGGRTLVVGGCQTLGQGDFTLFFWKQTSCAHGVVQEWNWQDANLETTYVLPQTVTALTVSPDGKRWVAGDRQGRLIPVESATKVTNKLVNQKSEITALAYSPDGKWVASGSQDSSFPLGLMDTTSGGVVRVKAKFDPISALAFSPDGKDLAVGTSSGELLVWNFLASAAPTQLASPAGNRYIITGLAFSPDNRLLAYGSRNGQVVVYDRAAKQVLAQYEGTSPVNALAFSPDANSLAIGQDNGKVVLIESMSAKELWSKRMLLPVVDLAYSADGASFAVAVQRGIHVYKMEGNEFQARPMQSAEGVPYPKAEGTTGSASPARKQPVTSLPSSRKLAEVLRIAQDEYVWLLPFDRLTVRGVQAMVALVPPARVEPVQSDRADLLVIRVGERSLTLDLASLKAAEGPAGRRHAVQTHELVQRFLLASYAGAAKTLEDAAISAVLAELGPGLRLVESREPGTLVSGGGRSGVNRGRISAAGGWSAANHDAVTPVLHGRVRYLKLDRFGPDTSKQVREWLGDGPHSQAAGYLLDLRGNPGGDLDSLLKVASRLLPKGQRITWLISRKNGERTEHMSESDAARRRLVVLVNEETAGTAELLACAVRESGIGSLVGTRTSGVDEVYTKFPLPDGSQLRVSTGRFYCPDGRSVRWEGQPVDVRVEAGMLAPSAVALGSPRLGTVSYLYQTSPRENDPPSVTDTQLRVGLEVALCLVPTDPGGLPDAQMGRQVTTVKDAAEACVGNRR
ncbi:MAG: hypothetical protein FJ245_09920 [Nitrospira sp.]|nr:hypothetical protein [Nitrospira sp.]